VPFQCFDVAMQYFEEIFPKKKKKKKKKRANEKGNLDLSWSHQGGGGVGGVRGEIKKKKKKKKKRRGWKRGRCYI